MNNPFESIDARLSNIEILLLEIKRKPNETVPIPEGEQFLTVSETADFLKLSIPTIYAIIHEKRIPFMRSYRRCYFLKSDLVNYLKLGREKSSAETAREAEQYLNGVGKSKARSAS